MTPERFQRLEALFDLVADLEPAEQPARLRQACGDDETLVDDALRLLAHERSAGRRLLETIAALAAVPPVEEPRVDGRRLGPYRVIRELGRGGMGIVFEAVRDDDTFQKRVAVKVVPTAAYSDDFLERFRQERQVLARLEHPHIARLLDGGTTEEGVPFFAMEFVQGEPILRYVQTRHLSIEDRIGLFLQVCDAVEYAHQNLVVHRDLKPAHILVTDGSVRLLDFGVAKLLDSGLDAGSTQTVAPLTPAYCSPEQLRGEPVTTRADVYALGLVLYELLTGERARAGDCASMLVSDGSSADTVARPSVRARQRGDRVLSRRLRGDIDAIVHTATQPEIAHRYRSVAALADDLRLHLQGRPIQARLNSRWYVTRRFVRRRWLPLSVTTLFLVTLAGGIVATAYQARRAERRFQQVRGIANTLMVDVHQAIRDLPASTKAQEVVVRTALDYLDDLSAEAAGDLSLQTEIAEGYLKVGLLSYSFRQPSLGRPDDARASYRKAEAILDELTRHAPDDPRVAIARSTLDVQVGELLHDTGQSGAAFASLERAIASAEAALARRPDDPALLVAVADAHASIITLFDARPAASRYVPRYLSLAERLARQQPDTPNSIADLGVAYSQAGRLAASIDRLDEATRYFRRNIELQTVLVGRDPQNTTIRRNLMLAWSNLADVALGPLGAYSPSGSGGPPADLDPARRREARNAFDRVVEQAQWLYERDPENESALFDYAVSLGRSAPSFPPGDGAAVQSLERSLALLERLEPSNPGRTQTFIIEFRGSLAERFRQTGQLERAVEEWRRVDGIVAKALAVDPDYYLPRRLVLPIVVNQALALAAAGQRPAAAAAARRAEQLAEELAAREHQYQRAAGWPPRVQGWLAGFHTVMGDEAAAARARDASRAMWRAVAARDTLPDDLLNEARAAIAAAR
jgi:serine/threonine protein kinase/tetratricopeptide (TPR) repeat protein